MVGNVVLGFLRDLYFIAHLADAFKQPLQFDVNDAVYALPAQTFKSDDLVDSVEEFG